MIYFKMDIEFATIDHDGCYAKYLSQADLNPITVYPSTDSPARVYNQHIRQSKAKYICFIHSDVLTYGLKEAIERTIEKYPDFGALGAVGSNKGTHWGRRGLIREVITVDSCCIVINREHGLLFDEINFPEYHLFTEKYCMDIRYTGRKVYVIAIDAYENKPGLVPSIDHFIHCSITWHKLGSNWGSYNQSKKRLLEIYPEAETT